MRIPILIAAWVVLAAAAPASAQQRPSEDELFGNPSDGKPSETPKARESTDATATTPAEASRPSEADVFGSPAPQNATPPTPELPLKNIEDPLKIGGQLYLQSRATWQQGVPPDAWALTAPALIDGYFDVRPNDRVRGMLVARMQYDVGRPDFDGNTRTTTASTGSTAGTGGAGGTATTGTPAQTLLGAPQANPRVLVDQLWLRFDIARTVFATVGKQHVKWGTGHFWNPTDYLHQVRRDPLAVFDARTGTTMVKLHVPWEKEGWNFYGIGLLDDGDTQTGNFIGRVGAAARGEVVLGTMEIGADAIVRRGARPRFGVDVSAGVGDIDVYGEAALRTGADTQLLQYNANAALLGSKEPYEPYDKQGFSPSVTAGASWSHKYNDEDTFTIGAEYFYNANGYDDPNVYPALLLESLQPTAGSPQFTPFYLGRHYAAIFFQLPNPGSWNNTTFGLSTIGNLSDKSFITRLDYSVLLVTYLRLEAYAAVHYGAEHGEFRMGFTKEQVEAATQNAVHTALPTPVMDVGLALRVNL